MTDAATEHIQVRSAAGDADLAAITRIARATGQEEDFEVVFPGYLRHLAEHGRLVVAERPAGVAGYGATLRIGAGPGEICMLTDLFVDPRAHGAGIGQAVLSELWQDQPRRITFASLHAHALPLYTRFGLDAWWPLLYIGGDVRALRKPAGWSVEPAGPDRVAALELSWTGIDRSAEHRFWSAWPAGTGAVASLDGQPVAAGMVGGAPLEYGICHLAIAPDPDPAADRDRARDAVLSVLSWLQPADGLARVCLPAPHPATRALLAAGWRVSEFDLHMSTEFGLLDARRAVLSPGLA
ncbi:MAG: GNAT family N-acetyltransferase [Streptosporangiaceae bacterium]